MKNKRKLIGVAILTIIFASGIGIYYMGQLANKPTEEEIAKAKEEIELGFKATEKELNEASGEAFLDVKTKFPDNMKESELRDAIHAMSHQKIAAEDNAKWGYIRMTEERVNRLLEVAKLNEKKWELNGELYVDILTRWSRGDFSRADIDHNAIWAIQGGNVGQATGLLSPWEEKKFIEETIE